MKKKLEHLYRHFSKLSGNATSLGVQQFEDWDSRGNFPDNPDPYFLVLQNGKKWFDWQQSELKKMYNSQWWWGWEALRNDYSPTDYWILKELCRWYNRDKLPEWLKRSKFIEK